MTVVSQTLAGPASIWASLCVYSAPAFTGKKKYTEVEISFAVAAQEGQYDNNELNVFEAVKNKSLNRIIKTCCCKYLAAQMFPVTFSSHFFISLENSHMLQLFNWDCIMILILKLSTNIYYFCFVFHSVSNVLTCRSLGVHFSKVRSLTLDTWEPELLKVRMLVSCTLFIYFCPVGLISLLSLHS